MSVNDFMIKYFTAQTIVSAIAAIAMSGCGQQAYVVGDSVASTSGAGTFNSPPKVDILLAEDNTGSMYEAYDSITDQLPDFLEELESTGWDYHFATTPLVTARSITQIVASHYDTNWGAEWIPPFPGASSSDSTLAVSAKYFRTPTTYSDFISSEDDIDESLGAHEPGLETIETVLADSNTDSSGFLRADALLVIFVISNGEDSSGAVECTRDDGWTSLCDATDLDHFQSVFESYKADSSLVRLYSAVSPTRSDDCLGATSRVGSRYMTLASDMRGESYDVCDESLASILDSLSNDLITIKEDYQTTYLLVDANTQPDPDSIVVKHYEDGDASQETILTRDDSNGFTYLGFTSKYAIDYPADMNWIEGYIIQLNGDARLDGNDTTTIEFRPLEGEDSAG